MISLNKRSSLQQQAGEPVDPELTSQQNQERLLSKISSHLTATRISDQALLKVNDELDKISDPNITDQIKTHLNDNLMKELEKKANLHIGSQEAEVPL